MREYPSNIISRVLGFMSLLKKIAGESDLLGRCMLSGTCYLPISQGNTLDQNPSTSAHLSSETYRFFVTYIYRPHKTLTLIVWRGGGGMVAMHGPVLVLFLIRCSSLHGYSTDFDLCMNSGIPFTAGQQIYLPACSFLGP